MAAHLPFNSGSHMAQPALTCPQLINCKILVICIVCVFDHPNIFVRIYPHK